MPKKTSGTPGRSGAWVRPLGLTASGAVAGAGSYVLNPLAGVIIVYAETGVVLLLAVLVVRAALFGTPEQHRRAFRLLRWLKDRPEHPDPDGETAGRTDRAPKQ